MRKDTPVLPDGKNTPSDEPAIDSSPRKHSMKEMLLFGAKVYTVAAIFFLLIWLCEAWPL